MGTMHARRCVIGLLVAAVLIPWQEARQQNVSSAITVIEGARVIDGVSNQPIEDAVIVVQGERIQQVGKRGIVQIPGSARKINASGKTILPGLIGLHGHVGRAEGLEQSEENFSRERIQRDANLYLAYGVTHLLSLGHDREAIFVFLADQFAGETTGARLYTAGLGFAAKGGFPANPYVYRPSTAEEARAMAQQALAKRPHFLKLWVDDRGGQAPKLTPELYGPILEEAAKRGVKVVAHIYALDDAKELIRRGVAALAHSVQDREVDDEFLRLAKQNGVVQITTLAGIRRNLDYAMGAPFLNDPALRNVFPAKMLDTLASREYRERMTNNSDLALIRRQSEIAAKNAKKIADSGVTIAIGTDSGLATALPGYWEHREMELLVEAGLTPMQAIRAATINGARFLGVDRDYGSIAPGKVADFVVVNANPLTDITNSRRIDAVWMKGKPVNRIQSLP
jgi:imidazolonepropionase-like amidohydrolase